VVPGIVPAVLLRTQIGVRHALSSGLDGRPGVGICWSSQQHRGHCGAGRHGSHTRREYPTSAVNAPSRRPLRGVRGLLSRRRRGWRLLLPLIGHRPSLFSSALVADVSAISTDPRGSVTANDHHGGLFTPSYDIDRHFRRCTCAPHPPSPPRGRRPCSWYPRDPRDALGLCGTTSSAASRGDRDLPA
jgi:hypothetical protein